MEFCTVDTAYGKVKGLISGGIRQFKGVPYGASTAGTNRFQRPQPPVPWAGVRNCLGYAQVSPQVPYDAGHEYARLIQFDLNVAFGGTGEDCLHLNIWTPASDSPAKRPVLFCIHGGGFAISSGNHPMYDGAKLASLGDVVVISVTHRLASFGYLNLHDLDRSGRWADAGAAGILDLIAALQWVRTNVASFGGDPHCVTIFGQSGGGWKVSTLLGMPQSRGLFHRAAVQSGSLVAPMSRAIATQVAQAFTDKLGLGLADLHKIQDLSWEQLLAAQTALGAHAFAPVLEDDAFAPHPASVPLIISTTLDDAGLFFDRFSMTEEELTRALTENYGDKAGALLSAYRRDFPSKTPYLLHAQIVTDAGFRRLAFAQAERMAAQPGAMVYMYLWEWTCPAYDGKFGALHAMDVSASLHNERDAILGSGSRDARSMCHALASAWLAFAKTGDPNNAALPTWPRFEADNRATLVLDRNTRIEHDPHGHLRRLWQDMPLPASVLG